MPLDAKTLAVIFLVLIGKTEAHGSLNLPIPRNNDGGFPADTAPGDSHGPSW